MTDLPPTPELDPTALTATEFTKGRRGFEPTEVRSALGRAADALRAWSERDARLSERIAQLESRLADAEQLDEQRLTAVLGEETARVIAAARSAAAEIRTKAAEEAERLVRESERAAEATAAALTSEASAARDEAERERSRALEESARVRAEAAEESTRVREEAAAAAAALREEAATESERLRAEADEAATQVREDAQARHDELLAQAATVLEERTSEAEAAAAAVREVADAELAAAREQALSTMEDARVAAGEEVERARARGREMVAEARELRERMLRDLAERRRTARRQIEAARAGRERIAEALRTLGRDLDAELTQLADSEAAAKRAGDAAAAAVVDDVDLVVAELEEQLPPTDAGGSGDLPSQVAAGGREAPEPGADDAAGEAAGPADDAAGPADEPGAASVAPDTADMAGAPPAPADGAPVPVDDDDDASATVHDLFERIRAERAAAATAGEELGIDPDLLDDDLDEDDLDDEHEPGDGDDGEGGAESGDVGASGGAAPGGPAAAPSGRRGGRGVAEVIALDPAGRGTPTAPATPAAAEGDVAVLEATTVLVADGPDDATGTGRAAEAPAVDAAADAGPEANAGAGAEPSAAATLGGDEDAAPEADAETSVLDRRDALLGPVERSLARVLKRLASDEQNEVLDRLRRVKRGRVELDSLLPGGDVEEWAAALAPDLQTAAEAGRELWAEQTGAPVGASPSEEDLDAPLRSRVEELLGNRRAHLQRVVDEADESGLEPSELADHLRAAYREWRSTSLGELAGDLATAGLALGTRAAAGADAMWCWVPDHGGLPCADAEDNALAGAVRCGEPFPTGDVVPPAHAGCRCLLAPAPQ